MPVNNTGRCREALCVVWKVFKLKVTYYVCRKNIFLLCNDTAIPLCAITALVAAFPIRSAVTVSEVYPDESAVVIRASANIPI
jgi:hypothetical protein